MTAGRWALVGVAVVLAEDSSVRANLPCIPTHQAKSSWQTNRKNTFRSTSNEASKPSRPTPSPSGSTSGGLGNDRPARLLHQFGDYRAAVDRSRSRGQTAVRRVIDADTHNALAVLFDLDLGKPKYTQNPVIRALTEEVYTGHVTDATDRSRLADEMTVAAPAIARESPERLVRLREDIQLVSLEALIDRFEQNLDGPHSKNESHWQEFFQANHFALQLIFSTPIVVEFQHATVQAADINGRGSRITDFLCANSVTSTTLIVEIKTPGAPLMAPRSLPWQGHRCRCLPTPYGTQRTDHPGAVANGIRPPEPCPPSHPRSQLRRLE